jgi:hypothetical protein
MQEIFFNDALQQPTMSILLLRTLTKKSIIGFGNYVDLTIQNLFDMNKHKDLLEIYYFFDNIDYNQEIKNDLYIINDRIIDKKNNKIARFDKNKKCNIGKCMYDIIDNKTEQQNTIALSMKKKEWHRDKKQWAMNETRIQNYQCSKKILQLKNNR